MTFGSLFSGVGGLDLGLHRSGHEILFQCEVEPWRREVLAKRFPRVLCYESIQEVGHEPLNGRFRYVGRERDERDGNANGSDSRHTGSNVDLLCGGFPCQDVSVAGRRKGLAGKRSGLFFEFARVARLIRPSWILLENVPGLLSSRRGRDFATVLGTLAKLGYGLAWRILDSRFFGVPQRRRRVFIVGTLIKRDSRAAGERAAQILAVGSRCEWHLEAGKKTGPNITGTLGARTHGRSVGCDEAAGNQLVSETLLSRQRHDYESETFIIGPLGGGNDRIGRRSEDDPNLVTVNGVRRLLPVECERLQGFDDGWTSGYSDSRRYAGVGDAVTVRVAEWIGLRLMEIE